MPYVSRLSGPGPFADALVVVDTEVPVVAHCLIFAGPDDELSVTMTVSQETTAEALAGALRRLADEVDRNPPPPMDAS
jgi:hypothetical protein